ncbi:MAG: hypothetical protein PHY46_03505 [Candidatus Omnitrophica bacterium]|nr:hypothetical protein [Candidatus Omnitrophota bacterium]MDD5355524.1 hypothetical protein [Candidatus Omnitrophota bacterium]
MRISKIIGLNIFIVIFALIHVFLQTEITKLGYQAKQNEDRCQGLVDNNRVLKYNIYALESPNTLDKYVLLKNSKLKVLKPVQVFGLYPGQESEYLAKKENSGLPNKNSAFLVFRKFVSARPAEAKQ